MNTRLQKTCLLMLAALLVSGCNPKISGSVDEDADAGRADFSIFVAVGDSLTAGYADGALYRQIQENSYANTLAKQIAQAGGGEFLQPLMRAKATGSLTMDTVDLGRPDRLKLGATGDPDRPASPETIKPTKTTEINVRIAGNGGFHNMGVPGAKSFHLGAANYGALTLAAIGGGTANPYFARFASSDTTSMLVDAAALVPTFFILWIGANDILLYALDGGATNNMMPPYGFASEDVTDPAVFTPSYNAAVAALKTTGNTGLLINIPDVATIPHFTTVPYDAIPLTKGEAKDLNAQLSVNYDLVLNAALGLMLIDDAEAKRRSINYKKGQNPILISDESLTDLTALFAGPLAPLVTLAQARPATKDDFILLPTLSKLGEKDTPGDALTKWGVTLPLTDADALVKFEYKQIEVARKAYNKTIKAAADADDDILFFDAAARLDELNESGISYGSGGVTSEFATGGMFSLDGVHPTARGYAVIANEIMKVIEEGFGASLPPVDPSEFTTVFYQ